MQIQHFFTLAVLNFHSTFVLYRQIPPKGICVNLTTVSLKIYTLKNGPIAYIRLMWL